MSSKIEWTEETWNPVTGCTKISDGCRNCYAEKMAKRLKAMGQANYANGFEVTTHPHTLEIPLHWRKPREVFVCSMSDPFHKDVPFEFIDKVLQIIKATRQHTYFMLTKRPGRMAYYWAGRRIPDNLWLGTTVENQRAAGERISHLVNCATIRNFLSLEPLLGPVDLAVDIGHGVGDLGLDRLGGVIVGGESGPKARDMDPDWARSILEQCREMGMPFYMKQMSGRTKREREAIPADLNIKELPWRKDGKK